MARKGKAKATREQLEAEAGQQTADLSALSELVGNRWKLMWLNFLAGLARGVGFLLGASLVGALLLGLLATLFDKTAETLGFKDLTLKEAVRATVIKFEEIRHDVEDTQAELAAERAKQRAMSPEPKPDGNH